jgi:hypothetical protein
MNSMNTMPGFTAEASLYKTNEHFYAAATGTVSSTQIVPQYGLCDKALYYCNRGYVRWCNTFDKFCDPEF